MARYDYATGGPWLTRYKIGAFAWVVPVAHREHYTDIYPISLVKGCEGEVAEPNLEL